jgi:hypothetical protein
MTGMPETAREWHDRVLRQAEIDGYRDADCSPSTKRAGSASS